MTILGCDYSTKSIHFAWRACGWEWRRFDVQEDLSEFILRINMYLPEPTGNDHLFIEMPWTRYNPGTGMKLQRIATIVDVIATQKGYDTHWVAIPSWRTKIFGKGKYPTKLAKELSMSIAKKETGKDLDDNTSDAICLALYGEAKLADL